MVLTLCLGFMFGCFLGSFLNVCVHRLPRAESVVHPGSRCYACGTPVQWYDNLPIISYLLLRGRCRWCGTGFSSRYLLMELLCGLLTAGAVGYIFLDAWSVPGFGQAQAGVPLVETVGGWRFVGLVATQEPWMGLAGRSLAAASLLVVIWYIFVSSVIDIDHMIIPDELTKGMQPLAPLLAVPLMPIVGGAYAVWPVQDWLWQDDAGRRSLELAGAVWRIVACYGVAATGLLLSLPLARWIYDHHVPEDQRWRAEDHRAFRTGVIWFVIAMIPTVVAILVLGLGAGAQPAVWRVWLVSVLGQALLGSLTGWLLPYLVGLVGTMAFRRNAMGYGDVKFLAPLGAVLGPIGVLYCFLLAACLGTLIGVPMRLLGSGREIPFGPYLAGGALIALLFGLRLHSWIFTVVIPLG